MFNLLAKEREELKEFSKPRKVLILSSRGGGNSHGLSYPYAHFKKELADELNLHFFEVTTESFESKLKLLSSFDADIYILSVPVRGADGRILKQEKVKQFVASIPVELRNKIIFFGPTDDPISPYFDILEDIRLLLISFTFADSNNYDVKFNGGSMFADAVGKHYNLAPTNKNQYWDEIFYSFIKPEFRQKLTLAWNFTHWRRLFSLFASQKQKCQLGGKRDIDVNCRFNAYSGWCNTHRMESAKVIDSMSDRYNVVVSENKIPMDDYFLELERSKILFSPFGWGAMCPKDYEAFLKGCLLIKPVIDHINIFPNVLIPYETYVPVKWDLSDLDEKITYYLEHESERQKIIKNASLVYETAMSSASFVKRVKEIVTKFDASEPVA